MGTPNLLRVTFTKLAIKRNGVWTDKFAPTLVTLSPTVVEYMPVNGVVAQPKRPVFFGHEVHAKSHKTVAFKLEGQGEYTCALVLQDISRATGIAIGQFDVRTDDDQLEHSSNAASRAIVQIALEIQQSE